MKRRCCLGLWPAAVILLGLQPGAIASGLSHPVFKAVPGSSPASDLSRVRELDAFAFPAGRDPRSGLPEFRLIQGKKWFLSYQAPKTGKGADRLPQAGILAHYKELTRRHGGSVLYEDRDRLYVVVPQSHNRRVWCALWTSEHGQYTLHILEEAAPGGPGPATGEDRNGNASREELESMKLHSLLQKAEKDLAEGDGVSAIHTLQEAILAIGETLPLTVQNLRLVEDTTHYRTRGGKAYDPGEPILINCLITGHGFRRDGPSYVIDIATDFLILTRDGKVLGSREEAFRFSHAAPAPVPLFPLDLSYVLTDAPKGTYTIHTIIRDINSGKQAKFANEILIR